MKNFLATQIARPRQLFRYGCFTNSLYLFSSISFPGDLLYALIAQYSTIFSEVTIVETNRFSTNIAGLGFSSQRFQSLAGLGKAKAGLA
jgi:hypothetical protein